MSGKHQSLMSSISTSAGRNRGRLVQPIPRLRESQAKKEFDNLVRPTSSALTGRITYEPVESSLRCFFQTTLSCTETALQRGQISDLYQVDFTSSCTVLIRYGASMQCAGIKQEITIRLAKQVFAFLWNAKTGHKEDVTWIVGKETGLGYRCMVWLIGGGVPYILQGLASASYKYVVVNQ
ncbi:uncharacterized protein BJ212DRAFT_1590064 [Suillus subaureus]|uniref:Uncharacterized protein n=1 Tax=Suillus subaureus TaxID=48587 RepID=A0A9P7E220_9AGAM|nr:uncharacterized protein BJ212DRAFT_1590064 [Suillus subaureus]KAG1808705.1 hypothetical protein BJ212DRAFT_1590064 [Suillus subaureus]